MSNLEISGKRGEEAEKAVSQERSEEFRRAAVEKYHNRGSRSVEEIAQLLGVSSWSLDHWSKQHGNADRMKRERRRGERSGQEKLKAVIEYEGLAQDERGEYLRREELQSEHIEGWKKSMEVGLGGSARSAAERSERVADKKKIQELERELRRKDKALAETTALLVLKKNRLDLGGAGRTSERGGSGKLYRAGGASQSQRGQAASELRSAGSESTDAGALGETAGQSGWAARAENGVRA